MSTFVDGPAAGVTLMFRRGPLFLRVVQGPNGWDVLDELDDAPAGDEIVHVYRRVGDSRRAHLLYRGRGGRDKSGWYEFADYEHVADADGEQLRTDTAWRTWARRQAA